MLRRSQIPLGVTARDGWARLDKPTRRKVIRRARRGKPHPDPRVAALAVGWAWAVLGPPEARHKPGVAATLIFLIESYITLDGGPHPPRTDVFDGSPLHDDNPYVRHIARRIEAATLVDSGQKPPANKDLTN